MNQQRIYAWKALLPRLSRGVLYVLVAVGAVWLLPGDPATLNTILTAALCIGAAAYLAAVYLKYGRDYYRAGETEVRLHRDGKETIIPISQVEFASYDGSALGVELHLKDEKVISFHEYLDLKPLVIALDNQGIRVEYKRMGKR